MLHINNLDDYVSIIIHVCVHNYLEISNQVVLGEAHSKEGGGLDRECGDEINPETAGETKVKRVP